MLKRAITRIIGYGGRQINVSPNNVVLITGCDSGLG